MKFITAAELLAQDSVDIPTLTTAVELAVAEGLPAIYKIDGMGRCVEVKEVDEVLKALWVLWDEKNNSDYDEVALASLSEDTVRDAWNLTREDPLPEMWLQVRKASEEIDSRMSALAVESEFELPPNALDDAFSILERCGWMEDSLPECVKNGASRSRTLDSGEAKRYHTYLDIMLALAGNDQVDIASIEYKVFESIVAKVRGKIDQKTLRPILKDLKSRMQTNHNNSLHVR